MSVTIHEGEIQHLFPDSAWRLGVERRALCGDLVTHWEPDRTPICADCHASAVAEAVRHERHLDADHAVAVEREAIAAYLESDRWNNRGPGWEEWEVSQAAAQAIRAGEHHREAGK